MLDDIIRIGNLLVSLREANAHREFDELSKLFTILINDYFKGYEEIKNTISKK